MLGLRFCVRAFSSCGKWGPLFIAVRAPLIIAASLVAEHRLQTCRLSNCGSRGLVAPRHVGSSQTRARTRVPCIGRQILNHCATREALEIVLIRFVFTCLIVHIDVFLSLDFFLILLTILNTPFQNTVRQNCNKTEIL